MRPSAGGVTSLSPSTAKTLPLPDSSTSPERSTIRGSGMPAISVRSTHLCAPRPPGSTSTGGSSAAVGKVAGSRATVMPEPGR